MARGALPVQRPGGGTRLLRGLLLALAAPGNLVRGGGGMGLAHHDFALPAPCDGALAYSIPGGVGLLHLLPTQTQGSHKDFRPRNLVLLQNVLLVEHALSAGARLVTRTGFSR